MKKYLCFTIILLLGCDNDINLPETSQSFENNINPNQDTIMCNEQIFYDPNNKTETARFSSRHYEGFPGFLDIYGNINFKNGISSEYGISVRTNVTSENLYVSNKFAINNGQITTINNISAYNHANYQIVSDGKIYTPKRIATWRGELQTAPTIDNQSGDEYYNTVSNKLYKYIASKGSWISK
jgi:hypothetical protein